VNDRHQALAFPPAVVSHGAKPGKGFLQMADTPIDGAWKIVMLMKRKPGISVEEFRNYYETRHAPMAEKYSKGVARYIRRYLNPLDHPETGPGGELPYDVITEIWFTDEAIFKSMLAYITTTIMPDEVIADEKNLFDRSSFKLATYTECETDPAKLGVEA
jgi:hypothetical protein